METHNVEVDYVGFTNRQRLTCYTCNGETIIHQPYMTYDQWHAIVKEFLEVHPCDLRLPER